MKRSNLAIFTLLVLLTGCSGSSGESDPPVSNITALEIQSPGGEIGRAPRRHGPDDADVGKNVPFAFVRVQPVGADGIPGEILREVEADSNGVVGPLTIDGCRFGFTGGGAACLVVAYDDDPDDSIRSFPMLVGSPSKPHQVNLATETVVKLIFDEGADGVPLSNFTNFDIVELYGTAAREVRFLDIPAGIAVADQVKQILEADTGLRDLIHLAAQPGDQRALIE